MKKLVNGEVLDMTPVEVAQRQVDETQHAERQARPKPPTIDERFAAIEARVAALEGKAVR